MGGRNTNRTDDASEDLAVDMRVYRYGVVGDLPSVAVDELRRVHELRNQLVEIERGHAERVAEVWAEHPELAKLIEEVEILDGRNSDVLDEVRRERSRTRSTQVPKEKKAALAETRKALREARQQLREAKADLYPVIKPQLAEAAQQRRAEIKATYRPAVDQGLYWASYNEVVAHHETSMRAIAAKRKAGQPAEIHFHSWSGEGTLAVQLQRQNGDPERSPELIADGTSKWRNVFGIAPVYDRAQWEALTSPLPVWTGKPRYIFRVRIGSAEHAQFIDLPVIMHRPIPPDADITMARITRRRVAGRYQAAVSVVVRLPAVPAVTEGTVAAVHLGWRVLPDKALRVAVVAGVAGPVPDSLREVVRVHDEWCEVVIPASWRAVHERSWAVRSIRDRDLDRTRARVVEWRDAHPEAQEWADDHPDVDLDLSTIDKWRSPRRFASLAHRLRKIGGPFTGLNDILQPWARQDRHLWEWEVNEGRQILGRRDDAWRCVAAWTTGGAAKVMIDAWAINALARVPDVAEEDNPQDRKARSNRVFASPASLRAALVNAAGARGVAIESPEGSTSSVHYRCGHKLDPVERSASVMVWCSTCAVAVDQDWNALQNLLRAAR